MPTYRPINLAALALVFLLPPIATAADIVRSENAACERIKVRAAPFIDQTLGGSVSEWRCDFSSDPPQGYFVIALRGVCHDQDGCGSTLLGWYAIRRADGEAFEYDMAEDSPGKLLLPLSKLLKAR